MAAVLALALVATLSANPDLEQAEKAIGSVRYPDAAKLLAAAWARGGNTRPETLRILELQGIAAGTLNRPADAQLFFKRLLSLDPERKLPSGLPPRVRTP